MPISQITPNIFVTSRRETQNVDTLENLSIDLVINAIFVPFPEKILKKSDIPIINVPSFDSPLTPIPMYVFKKSIQFALPVIKDNGQVLVYCLRGVHRSAAIATTLLIAQGYTSDEAIKLIKEKRPIASPNTFYIKKRILKFEKLWNEGQIQI